MMRRKRVADGVLARCYCVRRTVVAADANDPGDAATREKEAEEAKAAVEADAGGLVIRLHG
jgi:hypothetical protein